SAVRPPNLWLDALRSGDRPRPWPFTIRLSLPTRERLPLLFAFRARGALRHGAPPERETRTSRRAHSSPIPRPRVLERAGAEEEIDDAALVRLQPVELDRRHRADVQPVDVNRVDELALPLAVVGDGAAHEGGADGCEHLLLRALHDRRE